MILTVQESSNLYSAARYDGTNGAEMVSALGALDSAADPDGVLLFTAFRLRAGQPLSGHSFRVPIGYWVVWSDLGNKYVVAVLSDAEFAAQYIETATASSKVSTSGDTMTGNLQINADLGVTGAINGEFQGAPIDVIQLLVAGQSTAILSGGDLTPNADPTKLDISAATGYIVDYDSTAPISPTNPSLAYISFPGATGVTPLFAPLTFYYVDAAGTLGQQATPLTPTQRRQNLLLGLTVTEGGTIIVDQTIPVIPSQLNNQLVDLMNSLGPFGVSGNDLSANGANLMVNKTAGAIFSRAFSQIPTYLDPHNATLAAQTPMSFRHISAASGFASALTTTLDVGHYDPGGLGVVTPVPGGLSTNFVVWGFANNTATEQILIQYGQETFSAPNVARNSIGGGSFIRNGLATGGALLGWVSVAQNATDLSNPAQAFFTRAPKFGSP